MKRVFHIAATLLVTLLLGGTPARAAPASGAAEYELKAAFLYNFVKFIDWPANTLESAPTVTICIVGDDPFGELLDRTLAGKSVHDRPLVVERHEDMQHARGCHVLFVSAAEEPRLAGIKPPDASTLTVGETDAFLHRGGMIAFAMEENRLRFEINADAAEHAGLRISSQLMKLATRVIRSES